MPWSGATGAIARGKSKSTACAHKGRSVHAWRWICGVKPKPRAVNQPSPHSIMHGLDKPGVFTTVSDVLDHVIVLNDRHLRRVLTAYISYYHRFHTQWESGWQLDSGSASFYIGWSPRLTWAWPR